MKDIKTMDNASGRPTRSQSKAGSSQLAPPECRFLPTTSVQHPVTFSVKIGNQINHKSPVFPLTLA
jgi:hypothetical protein